MRYIIHTFSWGGTWYAVFDTHEQRHVHWSISEEAAQAWIRRVTS